MRENKILMKKLTWPRKEVCKYHIKSMKYLLCWKHKSMKPKQWSKVKMNYPSI